MKIENLWVVLATNRHFDNPPKCWQDLVYHAVPSESFGQGSLRPEEIYAVYTDQDEAKSAAQELWSSEQAKRYPEMALDVLLEYCNAQIEWHKSRVDEDYYSGIVNAYMEIESKIRKIKGTP